MLISWRSGKPIASPSGAEASNQDNTRNFTQKAAILKGQRTFFKEVGWGISSVLRYLHRHEMMIASEQRRCEICGLKPFLCLCAELTKLSVAVNITVVMPIQERKRATNSGKLVNSLLHQANLVTIGASPEERWDASDLVRPGMRNVLLYPETARTSLPSGPEPLHVIVPDGNWKEASKIARRLRRSADVVAIALPMTGSAPYELRRRAIGLEQGLPTLVAIAHLLGHCGEEAGREHLLQAFAHFVARHKEARRGIQKA